MSENFAISNVDMAHNKGSIKNRFSPYNIEHDTLSINGISYNHPRQHMARSIKYIIRTVSLCLSRPYIFTTMTTHQHKQGLFLQTISVEN